MSSIARRSPLRRFQIAAAAVAVLGVTAACSTTEPGTGASTGEGGGSTLDQVTEEQSITVGFANERPYAYQEGGELKGQAPAVDGYIFDQIGGIELEQRLFEFGALIQALNADRVDAVTAGMFITPERCEQAAFSDPVYIAATSLLTTADNPKDLTDYESVANSDAKLAVMNGAVEVDQAKGSGVPEGQLQIVPDQQSGLDAVKSGRVDAFALTGISLRSLAEGDDSVAVSEGFIPVIDGEEQIGAGATVFRKEDSDLLDAYNAELDKLIESDKWLELVEPYGFTEAERPDPDLTAEDLCQG
jgi:polar amino acid transport system substrate-binding protein